MIARLRTFRMTGLDHLVVRAPRENDPRVEGAHARQAVPLSAAAPLSERELLRRYHRMGDLEARRALVERMMPLVRRLAQRYANRGESTEDLIQVGSMGL